jgi:hypothetical protein
MPLQTSILSADGIGARLRGSDLDMSTAIPTLRFDDVVDPLTLNANGVTLLSSRLVPGYVVHAYCCQYDHWGHWSDL